MTTSRSLIALGDELEAAARRTLVAAPDMVAEAIPAPRRRRRRRLALALVTVVIAVPGGALAARHLLATDEVAASMPAGTLALAGTEPTCVVVHAGVEFHCRLARAPSHEVDDWKGTVEPTVDSTKHVNGGCRSLTSDGRTWQCYIGQAAVDQDIISAGFLGEASAGPGVG